MKQSLSIVLFLFWTIAGFTATGIPDVDGDSSPKVKVITNGGKIIIGRLVYMEQNSILISPGNSKEERKGFSYQTIIVPYTDIISVRYRDDYWIGLLLGLPGVAAVTFLASRGILFDNNLGRLNEAMWISVLFFGVGLWGMFTRKRWLINGSKAKFEKFKNEFYKKMIKENQD